MRGPDARRAAIVIGLFVALFAVRFALESPTYTGATFLLVLPTVLAALWFGVWGGLGVAVAASVGFFLAEWGAGEEELHTVVWATIVRLGALVLVAVLVAQLFARQLAMARELEEAEAVRAALRPAALAPRPSLELAAHYLPAQQGVGGDFVLTAEGPRDSTVLLVRRRRRQGRGGGASGGVRAHLAGDLRAVRGRPGAAAAAGQRRADRPRGAVGGLRDGGVRGAPAGRCDAGVGDGGASAAAAAGGRGAAGLRRVGAAAGTRRGSS